MKILVNEKEIPELLINASEKQFNCEDKKYIGIVLNFEKINISIEELVEYFSNIEKLTVVREEVESGEEVSLDYSKYNSIIRFERRINDESDITFIYLAPAETDVE